MFASNPINYVNVIAGIVAIIVSILILMKDVRATLNLLFFYSLLAWGVSLVLNGLNFLYKHPITGAKIIRDVVSGAGSVGSFLIFATAFSMYKGEHYLKKWYVNFPLVIVAFANTVVGLVFDTVVYDSDDGVTDLGTGIKTTQEPWVMIFLYLIPIIMISLAIFYFAKTRKEVEDPMIKKRILLFILGFTFIIIGVLIFGAGGIVEQLIVGTAWEFIIWIFAELFWVTAPILMIVGFNIGKISLSKEEENTT
ncbi:MAG: hypothetical protein FK732_07865 [Asgard group archaeon]|nr:hypothetical protein [Asgard group archaeon]